MLPVSAIVRASSCLSNGCAVKAKLSSLLLILPFGDSDDQHWHKTTSSTSDTMSLVQLVTYTIRGISKYDKHVVILVLKTLDSRSFFVRFYPCSENPGNVFTDKKLITFDIYSGASQYEGYRWHFFKPCVISDFLLSS